jgi:SAM-dependent methyltransferase
MAWNDGYVADVTYAPGYYREQSPDHLALCCLLAGVVPVSRPAGGLTYLELGCGRGRGAMCLAASNPDWRIIAIDFMPAHIAEAREMAAAAGIDNIEFLEADISTLDPATLPELDIVSGHGLWTWVSETVKAGVVRILSDRLRPGGIVHLSYNTLPAWQKSLGFQRLLRTAGDIGGGRSDRKAMLGLDLARKLAGAGAIHLDRDVLEALATQCPPEILPEYLAHEYMNGHWRPCFHGEVAAALAEAKLDYVASGEIFENFPELILAAEQRAIQDGIGDSTLRELVKDLCLKRGLRHDIYMRGQRRISRADRDAALANLVLALIRPVEEFVYELILPAGTAAMDTALFGPVVAALSQGPCRVGDLMALPELGGRLRDPAELVGMLVGTAQVTTVARPEAGLGAAAARLNHEIGLRVLRGEPARGALASLRLGGGLYCEDNDYVAVSLIRQLGRDAPTERWADALGMAPDSPERPSFVGAAAERHRLLAPIWQHAGVI